MDWPTLVNLFLVPAAGSLGALFGWWFRARTKAKLEQEKAEQEAKREERRDRREHSQAQDTESHQIVTKTLERMVDHTLETQAETLKDLAEQMTELQSQVRQVLLDDLGLKELVEEAMADNEKTKNQLTFVQQSVIRLGDLFTMLNQQISELVEWVRYERKKREED